MKLIPIFVLALFIRCAAPQTNKTCPLKTGDSTTYVGVTQYHEQRKGEYTTSLDTVYNDTIRVYRPVTDSIEFVFKKRNIIANEPRERFFILFTMFRLNDKLDFVDKSSSDDTYDFTFLDTDSLRSVNIQKEKVLFAEDRMRVVFSGKKLVYK